MVFGNADKTKYESIMIPLHDTWGVLMRCNESLAQKEAVTIADLAVLDLIIPRQLNHLTMLSELLAAQAPDANIIAEYNLIYTPRYCKISKRIFCKPPSKTAGGASRR